MRSISKLFFLVIGICFFNSCQKDQSYGLDVKLKGPEVVEYDSQNSTDTDLSICWNGISAENDGAVSFTVELLKTSLGIDVNPLKQVILVSDQVNDAAVFSGLKSGQKFFVRARANYQKARFSDWTYIMSGDTAAVIKVGTGVVDESIDVIQRPSARLCWASSRQLALNYSTTAFSDRSVDISYDFKIELYRDEQCKDLQVSLDLPASLHSRNFVKNPNYFPGFVFSGLTPSTDYWCKVTCYNPDKGNPVGKVVKFTTLQDDKVMISDIQKGAANPGDVILMENFDELSWGGDMVNLCAGISRKDRSKQTVFSSPVGDRTGSNAITLSEVDGDFNYCKYHNEYGLFNSVGASARATSLAEWGQLHEDSKATKGTLCVRPGMVKMGAGSKLGILITPELSSLKGTATVKVKFRACNYNEEAKGVYDTYTKALYIVDGVSVNPKTNYADKYYNDVKNNETTFEMDHDDYGWHDYEFVLSGVKPTSRIGIGGTRSVVSTGQNRFFLDKFSVEVVSYE